MSKKLTIILTLKDRIDFTYRWMNYMNDIKCPYHILIADGGESKSVENGLSDYSKYPNLNYTYIRYPFDRDLSIFYKKLVDVIARVTTPYMLLADNDDFYILDHFYDYINFLDKNQDYVSCGGSSILLRLLNKDNEVVNDTIGYNFSTFLYNQPRTIDNEINIDRIQYFFTNVEPNLLWWNWNNIHRKDIMVKIFNYINSIRPLEIVVMEIYFHLALLNHGKIKQFESIFYVRQDGTSQLTKSVNNHFNLSERFIINNSIQDVMKLVDVLFNLENRVLVKRGVVKWFILASNNIYQDPNELKKRNNFINCLSYLKNFLIFFKHKQLKYFRISNLEKYLSAKKKTPNL